MKILALCLIRVRVPAQVLQAMVGACVWLIIGIIVIDFAKYMNQMIRVAVL